MFVTHAMGKKCNMGEGVRNVGVEGKGVMESRMSIIEEMRSYTNLKEIDICM